MDAREQLEKAMYILLDKYPIEKITVDMIVKQSDVSKTSFYRNYQDKYQLMIMCFASFVDKPVDKEDWTATLNRILCFMYDNKKVFENLFKSEGPDSFSKFLYANYLHKLREFYMRVNGIANMTIFETHLMELYISGVVHCQKQWIKRGMDLPPSEMAHIILEGMPDIIKSVLRG